MLWQEKKSLQQYFLKNIKPGENRLEFIDDRGLGLPGVAEIESRGLGEFHRHSHDHAEAYYILSGYGAVSISNNDHTVRPVTTFFPKIS